MIVPKPGFTVAIAMRLERLMYGLCCWLREVRRLAVKPSWCALEALYPETRTAVIAAVLGCVAVGPEGSSLQESP